jgi:succinyl-CoA synthetase alpha subunit
VKSAARPRKKPPISSPGNVTKPVVGFIAGLTAPPGRRMGHAGAIISGASGTAQGKIAAMKASGIHVCENLGTLGELCAKVF